MLTITVIKSFKHLRIVCHHFISFHSFVQLRIEKERNKWLKLINLYSVLLTLIQIIAVKTSSTLCEVAFVLDCCVHVRFENEFRRKLFVPSNFEVETEFRWKKFYISIHQWPASHFKKPRSFPSFLSVVPST